MKNLKRIESGSYRYHNGEEVYAIERCGNTWEVFALHHRAMRECPLLGSFKTLKAACKFASQRIPNLNQVEFTKLLNGEWCDLQKMVLNYRDEDERLQRLDELEKVGYIGAGGYFFDPKTGTLTDQEVEGGIRIEASCWQIRKNDSVEVGFESVEVGFE